MDSDTRRVKEIPADVVHAANAWAQQEGWRDLTSCMAHPLTAFAAGMAAGAAMSGPPAETTVSCTVCGDPTAPNQAGLPLCDAVTCWREYRFRGKTPGEVTSGQ